MSVASRHVQISLWARGGPGCEGERMVVAFIRIAQVMQTVFHKYNFLNKTSTWVGQQKTEVIFSGMHIFHVFIFKIKWTDAVWVSQN